jgi:hypothetical protein
VEQSGGKDEQFSEDESEDSDYESGVEQAGCSTAKTEVSGEKESGQDILPILSIGSFAR